MSNMIGKATPENKELREAFRGCHSSDASIDMQYISVQVVKIR